MEVQVRFFARYRELVGSGSLALDVPSGSTAADVFDSLAERYPALREMRQSTLMAMNEEFVRPETRLVEGAELVLMPPVSGGA